MTNPEVTNETLEQAYTEHLDYLFNMLIKLLDGGGPQVSLNAANTLYENLRQVALLKETPDPEFIVEKVEKNTEEINFQLKPFRNTG